MKRLRERLAAGLIVTSLLLTACQSVDVGRAAPVAPTAVATRQVAQVRRAAINEQVEGVGRVVAERESALAFRVPGRVKGVNVTVGQPVKKGDVLIELDPGQLLVQAEIARVNVQIAELRAVQSQAPAAEKSSRVAAAQVAAAEANYARAVADRERLKGSSAAADLAAAQADVNWAKARLAEAQTGVKAYEIQEAEHAIRANEATLKRNEQFLEQLKAGAKPETIRELELDVERAKNSLFATQADRDALKGRQSTSEGEKQAADARVAAAHTAVTSAEERLERAKQPGKPAEIDIAQRDIESTRMALSAARQRLADLNKGLNAAAIEGARAQIAAAEARAAQVHANQAGLPNLREAADRAVDSAAAFVAAAKAVYEQRLAEEKAAGGESVEVAVAKRGVDLAKLSLQAIEEQIEASRLRAPFDGVISELAVREGDSVTTSARVGLVADPSTLQIAVDISGDELSKIAVGQTATVKVGRAGDAEVPAQVATLPSATNAVGTLAGVAAKGTVRLTVTTPQPFDIGSVANVTIFTQRKDGALLLPVEAIRRFGNRTLVYVLSDDGRRREVEVETGVTTQTDIEIVRGVTEGQTVVLP